MNFTNIIIISLVSSFSLYVAFLIIGVGGIAKNRRAQGLDKVSNKK